MSNVQRIKKPNGVEHLYFRKRGHPRVKLKSPWPDVWEGSALEAEVNALLAAAEAKPLPGTLKAALRIYELEDPDFRGLADSTKAEYRRILGELQDDFGDLPVSMFKPAYLLTLRNAWALRGHRTANTNMQVLKNVLWPCVIAGQLGEGDPFAMIPQARRPADAPEPHRLWSIETVETVIEAAIRERQFGLARAIALARFAGARRGDVVKIAQKARYTQPGGNATRIRWLSGKRKVLVDMPEDAELTRWLDATPASQPLSKWQAHRLRASGVVPMPPTTIVFNTRNKRFTESGLGQALADLVERLFSQGLIDSAGYDLHGLRHTMGVEAAISGASDAQGAALMGHRSPSSFATYRRQADRIRMTDDAAEKIRLLRERARNAAVNGGVNSV